MWVVRLFPFNHYQQTLEARVPILLLMPKPILQLFHMVILVLILLPLLLLPMLLLSMLLLPILLPLGITGRAISILSKYVTTQLLPILGTVQVEALQLLLAQLQEVVPKQGVVTVVMGQVIVLKVLAWVTVRPS